MNVVLVKQVRDTYVERKPITRGDGPELTEASVVVSGGRGVGSADDFAVVEGLADFGVVGDLFKVAPQLTDEIIGRKG